MDTATPTGDGVETADKAADANEPSKVPGPMPSPGEIPGEILGEVVGLMMSSPAHKHLLITDLEWLVVPALMTRQFRLWRREGRPVGFASWALVSEEVEQRIRSGMPRLRPDEWQGGDRAWLVDVVAPFGNADRLVADLKRLRFKDREMMALRPNPNGKGVMAVAIADPPKPADAKT